MVRKKEFEDETKYRNLEDWEKVEFLINLEFEAPEGKWKLIENIIKDTDDYDLARIQALKILEIAEIPSSEKTKIAKTLEHIVINDEDIDIRHNAFAAILKITSISKRKHILNILLDDPEFQKSAARNLNAL